VISTNELFFVLKKDMQLPPAKITSELTPSAASNVCSPPLSPSVGDRVGSNTYTLHLSSPVLARSVYISFGNLDAKLADNYFDLLPGQPTDLTITSAASLDDLKASMRVISLTDAFAPHEAQVSAGAKYRLCESFVPHTIPLLECEFVVSNSGSVAAPSFLFPLRKGGTRYATSVLRNLIFSVTSVLPW
jgi:hypothetical protein